MVYDMTDEPPPAGSLLESLFLLITKRRQEADYLKTRVLISAMREERLEKNVLQEDFEDYLEASFPYHKSTKEKKDIQEKGALKEWIGKGALKVKPIWRAKDNKALVSRLRRGVERTKKSEELRRKYKHRR